jgi:N-acetyl-anhydromuramyl-L-alanine amidase AmpD
VIPTAAILAECERRSYIEPQVLAVLTLAIEEDWTAVPAGFFDQLANLSHLTVDPWYNLANLRGKTFDQWQTFKTLLYRHIWAAKDLYDGKATVMPKDDYARAIIAEGQRRGITQRGIVIALATTLVESNLIMCANAKVPESMALPHEAVGSDGMSVGLFQQQVRKGDNGQWWWADAATCMDPAKSAGLFYDRLDNLDYNGPDSPGSYAQAVQQSAFPDRYDARMSEAQAIYNRLAGAPVVTDPSRPDFNEYWVKSGNSQSRNGTDPDLFLLHTQEADGNADSLAHWLGGDVGVSYHYTISKGVSDDGVTVCDVVDTDLASWSVLSANNRSINLCFAGSRAAWTRQQWLDKAGRAIDIAAYIAVQDCKKYGIALKVLAPPYAGATATSSGISDHAYVTKVLKDGTHTDVGPNFPWDTFAAAVTKYASGAPVPQPQPQPGGDPVPAKNFPEDYSDRELLEYIADQLGPGYDGWGPDGDLGRNAQGQRRTFRAGFAAVMRKLGA